MKIEDVLGSSARVRVLRALFERDGVSGRQISARAGVSPSSGKTVLDDLADRGVVLRARGGKRHLYEINRSHLFVEPLETLFLAERRYLRKVAIRVGRTLRPGEGAPLRALGVDAENGVTLLLTPPLPGGPREHRRIDRLLWFSFGLHLAAMTTDPDAVRSMEKTWVATPGALEPEQEGKRGLIAFFDVAE